MDFGKAFKVFSALKYVIRPKFRSLLRIVVYNNVLCKGKKNQWTFCKIKITVLHRYEDGIVWFIILMVQSTLYVLYLTVYNGSSKCSKALVVITQLCFVCDTIKVINSMEYRTLYHCSIAQFYCNFKCYSCVNIYSRDFDWISICDAVVFADSRYTENASVDIFTNRYWSLLIW